MNKTVKFFTLGCKVNQYDAEVLKEHFLNTGLKELKSGLKADVYVVNTCTVTHAADRKSRYYIQYARRSNPKAQIFVAGCLAELGSDRVLSMPGVTQVLKRKEVEDILSISSGISDFSGRTRAFLKIQDGCNNYCAYCKVPLVRGKSRSRSLDAIKKEARRLVQRGFKEIVLCGICLGAYGRDLNPKKDLVDALKELEDIPGLLRIRLSSIEAGDVSERLIKKMAGSPKLCRHLHIPMQSGDDAILARMKRRYRSRDYLALIRKIKRRMPDIAITTDILVGFPGEKEANFHKTLELIRKIVPLKTHIFPYSPRPGTSAYGLKSEAIPPNRVNARIAQLRRICAKSALTYMGRFIGKRLRVLIEGHPQGNLKLWQGYTDNYIKVVLESGMDLKNKVVEIRPRKIEKDHMRGEVIY